MSTSDAAGDLVGGVPSGALPTAALPTGARTVVDGTAAGVTATGSTTVVPVGAGSPAAPAVPAVPTVPAGSAGSAGSGGTRPATATRPVRARRRGRLLRSELRLVFGRRRNLVLLGVLALAPVLLGLAVDASNPGPGAGPSFLFRITENGLFLVFTSLSVTVPIFLPLAVAVASGDAVAGEAAAGTLRTLLVVPTGRTRLLAVKYAGVVAFAAACVAAVAVLGLLVGRGLFPHGPVTLLSGTRIGYGPALGRTALICAYVLLMLAALAAVGIAVSTLTDVPMAAMATVAVVTVASEIADSLPQLAVIHPYLITDPWLAFGDLLRSPVNWTGLAHGVVVAAAYAAIALSVAWARLTTRDVAT